MQLRHILVAADQSDTSRNALRVALTLAHRAGARLTVMTTVPPRIAAASLVAAGRPAIEETSSAVARLEQWMEPELRGAPPEVAIGLGVTFGIPGVEICRFADEHEVDLIVVGRKQRSQATRLLLGDTADAVARRSRTPCLFVPPGVSAPERVLVALDGSRRGLTVLRAACGFAEAVGARLDAVTVEPARPDEPPELAALVPTGRSDALRETIAELADCAPAGGVPQGLVVRRGPIAETLLVAVEETAADALVLGFHRGGPPGVLEAGSIARHLTHSAACAVLTVPF
jgi:nucleotide-binding universal stress UspA family protein